MKYELREQNPIEDRLVKSFGTLAEAVVALTTLKCSRPSVLLEGNYFFTEPDGTTFYAVTAE
jgi:hypothetical protein